MKYFLVVAVLVLAASQPSEAKSIQDRLCAKIGETASSIMKARQAGVPIGKMIEVSDRDARVQGHVREMVISAYEAPKFSSEPIKREVIAEFGNTYALDCYKALSK